MWSRWLIPVLFIFGATQSCHTHPGLSCVNDYMSNVSCEWQVSAKHAGNNCTLQGFRRTPWGNKVKECKLEPLSYRANATRACSIVYDSLRFSFAERMRVQVTCNGTAVFPQSEYHPGRNVKLRWPDKISVVRDNITWSRGSPFPESIKRYEFELQFKRTGQSWKEARLTLVQGMFTILNEDYMVKGERYEARVRVKPVEPSTTGEIQGQWSDWSPSVSWSSEIGMNKTTQERPLSIFPSLGIMLLPVIFCIAHTCKCVLKTGDQHVPDPSKFFKPLLSLHEGNLQKWLRPEYSTHSYVSPQVCGCEISPVEISEASDSALALMTPALFQTNQTFFFQQTSGTSQSLSSGFSNMGYFYTELQSGFLCLESCPVYFTYDPEAGSSGMVQSASSYERVQNQQQMAPLSPDSGFDMGEKEEEEESDDEKEEERAEMCRGVNVQHLVSFVLSLPESSRVNPTAPHTPVLLAPLPELSPWPEDAVVSVASEPSELAEGAVARPASMVVQPCTSGYLSLKEMQKYSNKSI
ncbi:interleukin-2 receptor subunit beta isoform X2 [Electrophorus electricus]|uniref:interleukin-2 receptor subunit beta isoform X2 n=1 Tax=Electrophorus electricus TaxID=8005 RepID=UPI0015D0B6B9|nr:interleukin-2 receptor subunit beta isoform X2 [Electrophorus electricus]